jgi:hypothetical protein
MMKKVLLIIALLVVIIMGAGGFYLWNAYQRFMTVEAIRVDPQLTI